MQLSAQNAFQVIFPKYVQLLSQSPLQIDEDLQSFIRQQLPLKIQLVRSIQPTFVSFQTQFTNLILKRPKQQNLMQSLVVKASDKIDKYFYGLQVANDKQVNKSSLTNQLAFLNLQQLRNQFRQKLKSIASLLRQKYFDNIHIERAVEEEVARRLYILNEIYYFTKNDLTSVATKFRFKQHQILSDINKNYQNVSNDKSIAGLIYLDSKFKENIQDVVQKRCRPFLGKKDFFFSKVKQIQNQTQSRVPMNIVMLVQSVLGKQKYRISKQLTSSLSRQLKNVDQSIQQQLQKDCKQIISQVDSLKKQFNQLKNNAFYLDIIRGSFADKYKMQLNKLQNILYLSNIQKYLQDVQTFAEKLIRVQEKIIQNRKDFMKRLGAQVEDKIMGLVTEYEYKSANSSQTLKQIVQSEFSALQSSLYGVVYSQKQKHQPNKTSMQQLKIKRQQQKIRNQERRRAEYDRSRKLKQQREQMQQLARRQKSIKEQTRKAQMEERARQKRVKDDEERQRLKQVMRQKQQQKRRQDAQNAKLRQKVKLARQEQQRRKKQQLQFKRGQKDEELRANKQRDQLKRQQIAEKDRCQRQKRQAEEKQRQRAEKIIKEKRQVEERERRQNKQSQQRQRLKHEQMQRQKKERQERERRERQNRQAQERQRQKTNQFQRQKQQIQQRQRRQQQLQRNKIQQQRQAQQQRQNKQKQQRQRQKQRITQMQRQKVQRQEREIKQKDERDKKQKQRQRQRKQAQQKQKKRLQQMQRQKRQAQERQKQKMQAEQKQRQLSQKIQREKRQAQEREKQRQKQKQQQRQRQKQRQKQRQRQKQKQKQKQNEKRRIEQQRQKQARQKSQKQRRQSEDKSRLQRQQKQKEQRKRIQDKELQLLMQQGQKQQKGKSKGTDRNKSKGSGINYNDFDDIIDDDLQQIDQQQQRVSKRGKEEQQEQQDYGNDYEDDFEQPDKENQQQQSGVQIQPKELITGESVKCLNDYMKGTSYSRKNKPNLEPFNNKDYYTYLFEEFMEAKKLYIFDSAVSNAILDFSKEMQDEEASDDDLKMSIQTIKEEMFNDYLSKTGEQSFDPRTILVLPFSFANEFDIKLIEFLPGEGWFRPVLGRELQNQQMQEKLHFIVEGLLHIFQIENQPVIQAITVSPESALVLQTFQRQLPCMLTLFALHYQLQLKQEVEINQYTVERFFYTAHVLKPFYEAVEHNEEQLVAFYDGLLGKYEEAEAIQIMPLQIQSSDPQYEATLQQHAVQVKNDFLLNKKLDTLLIMFQILLETQQEEPEEEEAAAVSPEKITIYCSLEKPPGAKPTVTYFIITKDQLEKQNATTLFDIVSEGDEQFDVIVFMDFSRHNGLTQYSDWTLPLWARTVQKRKLNPTNAFRAITFAMSPYYIAFKEQD